MTPMVASLPRLHLRCDGRPLPEAVSATMLAMVITHEIGAPCLCRVELAESHPEVAVADALPLGAELIVALEDAASPLYRGVVDSVSCERRPNRDVRWTVEATDALQTLARNRHMRVFVQRTPAAIVEEVAGAHGIEVAKDDDGPMRQRVVQQGQTDLEFVRRLLDEDGLGLVVVDGTLRVIGSRGRGPTLTLDGYEHILALRHSRTHRLAPSSVRFSGMNFLTHQVHGAESVLEGFDGPLDGGWFWTGAAEDDAQAQRRANAVTERHRQGLAVLEGTVEGEWKLHPGRQVQIANAGARFDGDYTVTRVLHRIDGEGGFVTEFSTRPPPVLTREQGAVAAYGTVTRLDDPDGQGRVQVALPAYGEIELGWLRVLTLGAGKNKGLVMLPDIDEDVLVIFPSGDPAQAVVLGGIYGRSGHPEWGIENRAVRRFALTSAGGQKVVLSDGQHSVRLENDAGSAVEIGEDRISIEAKGDIEISAPGRAIRILAKSVDFEQG